LPDITTPYQRAKYYVTVYVDDIPLPFKSMHCLYDGDSYWCNWDNLATFLDSRSLPKAISPETVCFGHLEGRDRPEIINGNMPWWLAAVISLPFAAVTLYGIDRCMKWIKRIKREK
jgi:hypothetical protein